MRYQNILYDFQSRKNKGTILKDIQPVEAALYCDEPIIITELVTCPYNGRKIVSPEDVTDYQHRVNILRGKE